MDSLFKSLRLVKGVRLLIRGGTTSVGLAAAAMAKKLGAIVASTSRKTGARYNAVAEEEVPLCDIAEVIGRGLKAPVVSVSTDQNETSGTALSSSSPS